MERHNGTRDRRLIPPSNAPQKEHQHIMLSRTATSSVAGRATAMRRLRRRASATSTALRQYCGTNGCASFLELDPETGIARCEICGFVRRTH